MTDATSVLLTRNLLEIFGEADPARRRAAIAEIWAVDGLFVDPHARLVGHDQLDEAVAGLHARFPGFVFTALGAPETFFEVGRLAWAQGPAGGAPQTTGLDVVTVKEGRIAALYTFLDAPE
jgi:hypothetical protein